jgi:prepilin-type N-terminal cleavage/methylation domain-containing protein
MNRKAFTLIELLAVIVILGIVLSISVPAVTGIINRITREAFASDAKMILKAIEYKRYDNENFIPSDITDLEIPADNFKATDVIFYKDVMYLMVEGQNRWEGLYACGSFNQIIVVSDDNIGDCDDVMPPRLISMLNTVFKNGSNYFVGSNPNNWIQFGSNASGDPLMWRIIRYDAEGIKIIFEGVKNGANPPVADGSIGNHAWDTGSSNKWERPATLSGVLNNWYNNLQINNEFYYIQSINWCIGGHPGGALSTFKERECINSTDNGGVFIGRTTNLTPVGLILTSDYISTSSSGDCTETWQTACGTNNFLYKTNKWYWTANAMSYTFAASHSYFVYTNGEISGYVQYVIPNVTIAGIIRPVLNLKLNVIYEDGDGTLINPYRI